MRGIAWGQAVIGMAAALYFGHSSAPAQPADAPEQPTILLFSGTDLWRHGGSVHGGLLWSPEGLDHEGFTFKLLSGAGVYRFHSGALGTDITARQSTTFALPGWRFIHENVQVTVFAGLDVQDHRLAPDDISARLRGQLVGVRSGFDFWYEPGPTSMLAADASASTIGRSYSARLAYGWRFLESLYLGPEVHALGSDNYRQFRAGFHATGLRTGPVEWAASTGWTGDSDHRGSLYARLSILTRR
jgi:hypothetical protein